MREILIAGNPNVGKSTLFNSLTKGHEHTGNFHGVTVEEKHMQLKIDDEIFDFIDLPGIYSLNCFSPEEEVSRDYLLTEKTDKKILMLLDANSLRKNLYLCLQLTELGVDYDLLINNYDYFEKNNNKLNLKILSENLNKNIEIINAKKLRKNEKFLKNYFKNDKNLQKNIKINEKNLNFQKKLININDNNKNFNEKIISKNKININFETNKDSKNKINDDINQANDLPNVFNQEKQSNNLSYLKKYIDKIKSKFSHLDNKKILYALNGIFKNLTESEIEFVKSLYVNIISDRYAYIDRVLNQAMELKKDFVYGYSKWDKIILKPIVMIPCFFAVFFLSIYVIFFLIGPVISDGLNYLLDFIFISPFMNFLSSKVANVWVVEFFSGGVFSSFLTILSFLPQVVLLFVFLTILEDSGLIARMSYVFDDFLSKFGLNGKAVYIILLGLGCNTMSCLACRNMSNKNLRIKTAILNPYISCMARLPIFVIVASAFFGKFSYFVMVGLYLLGLIVALIVSFVLNKTILKTGDDDFLLEFAPLRKVDFKHVASVSKENALDFVKRVFGIIVSIGVIVWILSHTTFSLKYTLDITESLLFIIADKISIIFKPIGLDNAGVVCALIVGLMAKEIIVSTFTITNGVSTVAGLISSLTVATSIVNFELASAVSFLIFSLLYAPCVSTLAVIKKEAGSFYMWFALISEFTIAYLLSFVVYTALQFGIVFMIISVVVISLIFLSFVFLVGKVKSKKRCCKK